MSTDSPCICVQQDLIVIPFAQHPFPPLVLFNLGLSIEFNARILQPAHGSQPNSPCSRPPTQNYLSRAHHPQYTVFRDTFHSKNRQMPHAPSSATEDLATLPHQQTHSSRRATYSLGIARPTNRARHKHPPHSAARCPRQHSTHSAPRPHRRPRTAQTTKCLHGRNTTSCDCVLSVLLRLRRIGGQIRPWDCLVSPLISTQRLRRWSSNRCVNKNIMILKATGWDTSPGRQKQ